MLGRKYSIETICYFDLVSDYRFLPQRTRDECVRMAKAFLLHLLGGLSLCQWCENCVIKVVDPLPRLWRSMGGQLGISMSCLSLLHS